MRITFTNNKSEYFLCKILFLIIFDNQDLLLETMKEFAESFMPYLRDFLLRVSDVGQNLSLLLQDENNRNKRYVVGFDLLQRINANMDAVLYGFDKLFVNQKMLYKIPIDLSLRTALGDTITTLYLLSLDDDILEEEISVIDRDFVKFLSTVLSIRHEYSKRFFPSDSTGTEQEYFDKYYSIYQDYLENDKGEVWKVKSFKTLRSEHNPFSKNCTLESMYQYLKNNEDSELKDFASLYMHYRVFSQTEHYSFLGRSAKNIEIMDIYKEAIVTLVCAVQKLIEYLPLVEKQARNNLFALNILDYLPNIEKKG